MDQIVSVNLEDILITRNALTALKDVCYVLRWIIVRDVNLDTIMKQNNVKNALETAHLVHRKGDVWVV